jgi:hypothetical protein
MHTLLKILILLFAYLLIGNAQAQSCSFKTQLRYQDGSIGCLEDLPIANALASGGSAKLTEEVIQNPNYAVARSKTLDCKAIGFAGDRQLQSSIFRDNYDKANMRHAVDQCMNQGCDCEIIIVNGNALVDKESLISGRSLTASTPELIKQVAVDEKQIQQELAKKQQLEKEQKALAEKARLEADKQLAEAKRIQQEQAKQAQSDKELAEKTRIAKEKQLAEENLTQTQLVKLQAAAKEKDELIARLQQEKVTASKALSDEARILALRKELEKEIRASIQNESSGAQGASKPKQAPQIFANRKALVIGNDAYKKVTPLLNAAEDAKVVAESLAALGFKVSLKLDVDRKQFQSEIRAFKNQVKAGDEVAIFYAGHGVQIASTNYLLPIDIAGQNEEEIRDDAISLQRILDDMTEKEAKFTLAMIDACRDNPFKSSGRSVIGTRGLAPTTAATGQMIVFSAGTGQQALDKLGPNDKSKNGLFTRVFVKEMQKAGVSVDRVVRNVRTEVVALAKSVGHNQVPAIYDQVVGEFYFKQ